jgi:hypothetical protein
MRRVGEEAQGQFLALRSLTLGKTDSKSPKESYQWDG